MLSIAGILNSTDRYMPWGEERDSPGTTPTSFLFTGQRSEMDEVGLYYYGARWYDPYLNRWIQPDTIIPQNQGVQAWDRYAFVNNNPYYHS
jgi:RHS repeat-associated protein